MNYKEYTDKDLESKNYAILYWDAEEPYETIVSLHEERTKAETRIKYLNKEADRLFQKGIATGRYGIHPVTDARVKRCLNYNND